MYRKFLLIVFTLFLLTQLIWAKKIIVKMATLAPEGTEWHGLLV